MVSDISTRNVSRVTNTRKLIQQDRQKYYVDFMPLIEIQGILFRCAQYNKKSNTSIPCSVIMSQQNLITESQEVTKSCEFLKTPVIQTLQGYGDSQCLSALSTALSLASPSLRCSQRIFTSEFVYQVPIRPRGNLLYMDMCLITTKSYFTGVQDE